MNIRVAMIVVLLGLPVFAAAQESKVAAGDIELSDLIERFAKRTGKQFILDPRVRAQVSVAGVDLDRLSYEKLLAILTVHQYAAVTQGDFTIVVPDANARQLPTPLFTERKFNASADEIVTMVLQVKNICAMQAVPVLRPLMPQAAHMAAYGETNTLILTDHAANVRRLVAVIEALEKSAPDGHGCEAAKSPG